MHHLLCPFIELSSASGCIAEIRRGTAGYSGLLGTAGASIFVPATLCILSVSAHGLIRLQRNGNRICFLLTVGAVVSVFLGWRWTRKWRVKLEFAQRRIVVAVDHKVAKNPVLLAFTLSLALRVDSDLILATSGLSPLSIHTAESVVTLKWIHIIVCLFV